MVTALGQLWLVGAKINWKAFYASEVRNRVALPTYPFERQQYWLEAPAQSSVTRCQALERDPILASGSSYIPSWEALCPIGPSSKGTAFVDALTLVDFY